MTDSRAAPPRGSWNPRARLRVPPRSCSQAFVRRENMIAEGAAPVRRTARSRGSRTSPDVVVAPDREHEADGDEDERPGRADHALHENGARDLRLRLGPAARVRGDAHRVAADRRRQHLSGRIADEVELRQPGERLVDPLRGEERLPAPGHPDGRDEEDHVRGEQVPAVARPDQVERLPRSICQIR